LILDLVFVAHFLFKFSYHKDAYPFILRIAILDLKVKYGRMMGLLEMK